MEFNSVLIRIRYDYGHRVRDALIWKGYGRGWEEFVTDYGPYVCGYHKPNYPVPAKNDLPLDDYWSLCLWLFDGMLEPINKPFERSFPWPMM